MYKVKSPSIAKCAVMLAGSRSLLLVAFHVALSSFESSHSIQIFAGAIRIESYLGGCNRLPFVVRILSDPPERAVESHFGPANQ